ncbi:MAG: Rrf2 family transcriptional regulator [Hyphomicrobiales bacterium]|uniref:RrF2 family transcriptional regulator n=1 Tax=Rhabdaerophilum calidifontis TaxID=2604328 RepID=UPI00123C685E|nr:Rrf2 family transcriptional regulator [Rhabdaerophilum calidifontis]MCA1953143.1 Rrf2 family transcriptional regulator [Hyphomicrobiales bacterium]MCA1999638.1 Rrf2 family transcriptional regulator [Hyphomicrobiales bacterium]
MQLRNQVEWALHCASILAMLPPGHFLSTRDLAELHGVPKEYLSKALQSLSQAGIVESTLGPSGGYRLARPPAEISFLDIVTAVEGRVSAFVCTEIRRNNPCRPAGFCDARPCIIARAMWAADEAWRASLRGVTIADIGPALQREVPEAQLQETMRWVLERAR